MSAVAGWAWTLALLAVIAVLPVRVIFMALLVLVALPAALAREPTSKICAREQRPFKCSRCGRYHERHSIGDLASSGE
jgi:hypothetical protein